MKRRKSLSTSAVAELLGVAAGSVANWIDKGQLKAGRTPGGHRRVTPQDLLRFLKQQKLPIPPELSDIVPGVLIVDDEQAVASWIADEISMEFPSYSVFQANDGFAAGDIVASERPSVVVLDLRMPGMDGFEVCRRIKAKPESADTVVIAITAYASPECEREIIEAGAVACLTKPLDIQDLLGRIKSAIEY